MQDRQRYFEGGISNSAPETSRKVGAILHIYSSLTIEQPVDIKTLIRHAKVNMENWQMNLTQVGLSCAMDFYSSSTASNRAKSRRYRTSFHDEKCCSTFRCQVTEKSDVSLYACIMTHFLRCRRYPRCFIPPNDDLSNRHQRIFAAVLVFNVPPCSRGASRSSCYPCTKNSKGC